MMKVILRKAGKYLLWLFLLSLPLTIFSIFRGTLVGVLFPFWQDAVAQKITDDFSTEYESAAWGDGWSVPGVQSFNDNMDTAIPFHSITRLSTWTWLIHLGFALPVENGNWNESSPLYQIADLEHLMRPVSWSGDKPNEL